MWWVATASMSTLVQSFSPSVLMFFDTHVNRTRSFMERLYCSMILRNMSLGSASKKFLPFCNTIPLQRACPCYCHVAMSESSSWSNYLFLAHNSTVLGWVILNTHNAIDWQVDTGRASDKDPTTSVQSSDPLILNLLQIVTRSLPCTFIHIVAAYGLDSDVQRVAPSASNVHVCSPRPFANVASCLWASSICFRCTSRKSASHSSALRHHACMHISTMHDICMPSSMLVLQPDHCSVLPGWCHFTVCISSRYLCARGDVRCAALVITLKPRYNCVPWHIFWLSVRALILHMMQEKQLHSRIHWSWTQPALPQTWHYLKSLLLRTYLEQQMLACPLAHHSKQVF